jgi:hypothetical protein
MEEAFYVRNGGVEG